MTRVLIVDDDPGQLRMLAHVIAARRRDLQVVTANTGTQAIEALQSSKVDLVLTDLQMPEMSGFELLTWLVNNRPQIPIFTMTAYPDAESVDRLDELGAVECFTKPLDITAVLQRLSLALTDGVGGHVRNIGLPAFLQLVEMERKSCVLMIESGAHNGVLHLDDGVLVDARTDQLRGDAAATAIAAWPSPSITIRTSRGVKRRTVERPLGFILLEAMRLQDEARRGRSPRTGEVAIVRSPSTFILPRLATADWLALVDATTATIHCAVGAVEGLEPRAQLFVAIYRAEVAAVAGLRLADEVNELVITTPERWTVLRPANGVPGTLMMLAFDPTKSTLVMERLGLDEIERELATWCGDNHGPAQDDAAPTEEVDELADWGE